jgi:hypothetical protein
MNHKSDPSVNWNVGKVLDPFSAGVGALYGLVNLPTLPGSVHRTALNAFKGNLLLLLLNQLTTQGGF